MNINDNKVSPEYRDYLNNSDKWKAISENIKLRDGCACKLCGSTKNLQVHHMNSKYRFKEENHPECLITLCAECHEKIHLYWNVCDSIKAFYVEKRHQEQLRKGYY